MSEASSRQTALVVAISDGFRKLTNGSPQIADKAKVGNDDLADQVLSHLDGAGWMLCPVSPEAEGATVPHEHYARVKTHLYGRIDTLKARAERAEAALIALADHHHRTLTASSLHDPENQHWPECPCKTCSGVRDLLPEQAADALAQYQAVVAAEEARDRP